MFWYCIMYDNSLHCLKLLDSIVFKYIEFLAQLRSHCMLHRWFLFKLQVAMCQVDIVNQIMMVAVRNWIILLRESSSRDSYILCITSVLWKNHVGPYPLFLIVVLQKVIMSSSFHANWEKWIFLYKKSGENSEKRKKVVSPTMVYFMHHCSQTLTINMNIENQYANRSKLECRSALLHEIMVVRGVDSLNGFIQ